MQEKGGTILDNYGEKNPPEAGATRVKGHSAGLKK